MNPAVIACLSTAVYAAGSVPVLLVGSHLEVPPAVRRAAARAHEAAAHARQHTAATACALLLLVEAKGTPALGGEAA